MTDIPVVTFAPFLTGGKEERQQVAKQVYDAFSTVGFIYLKDHGISQTSVAHAFEEACHVSHQPRIKTDIA